VDTSGDVVRIMDDEERKRILDEAWANVQRRDENVSDRNNFDSIRFTDPYDNAEPPRDWRDARRKPLRAKGRESKLETPLLTRADVEAIVGAAVKAAVAEERSSQQDFVQAVVAAVEAVEAALEGMRNDIRELQATLQKRPTSLDGPLPSHLQAH
jgi:hypothetical protein